MNSSRFEATALLLLTIMGQKSLNMVKKIWQILVSLKRTRLKDSKNFPPRKTKI